MKQKLIALVLVAIMTLSACAAVEMMATVVAAAKSTTLTATPPASATAGKSFAVSGKLKAGSAAVGGATITLYKVTAGATRVGTARTDARGGYSMRVTEKAAGTYRYRAVFSGDARYGGTSASTTVKVTPNPYRLTLTAPTMVYVGGTITLSGYLTQTSGVFAGEGLPGQIVWIYAWDALHQRWQVRAAATTDGSGYYSWSYTARSAGRDNFQAQFVTTKPFPLREYSSVATTVVLPVQLISTKLTLTAPATVYVGDTITLSGYLTQTNGPFAGNGLSGQIVWIKVWNAVTKAWATPARVTTDGSGYYSWSYTASTAGRFNYLVQFSGSSSAITYFGSLSGVVSTVVEPVPLKATTLKITDATWTVSQGSPVTVDGYLLDANGNGIDGKLVTISVLTPNSGIWQLMSPAAITDSNGHFTFTTSGAAVSTFGTYQWQARFLGYDGYASAVSNMIYTYAMPS